MSELVKDPTLAAVYALQPSPPSLESPVYWRCGGWQVMLVENGENAGEFVGIEQPRHPQIISRGIVRTAVTALQRYRRLSPAELMSIELSSVGDVVRDDYVLASDWRQDDYGFVLHPGAAYRRKVRSIADCAMSYLWSSAAALAQFKGLGGMGALAATVDRVRALEAIALGEDG